MKKRVATMEEEIPNQPQWLPPAPICSLKPLKVPEVKVGPPRAFLGNRFVYAVISQRARGLSIGVNVNPDKYCNFACAYCEVNRDQPARDLNVDLKVLRDELDALLTL